MEETAIFKETIRNVFYNSNEHIFKFMNELSDEEKCSFLNEIATVDFSILEQQLSQINHSQKKEYKSASYIKLPKTEEEIEQYQLARKIGINYIKQKKIAIFLVAGGQGTRLGFNGSKGKFPIGKLSNKTLFQIHAEKILAYIKKYNVSIPWIIMTSNINYTETKKYFEDNNYFNIDKKDIFIFKQNMIPSLDKNGKLILKSKKSLTKNPDGHGGSLTALQNSGILQELIDLKIELISYFQVDNPLVKIIDPVFIGFHLLRNSEISSKAIKKIDPDEKVGVFVEYEDSTIGVIEYSDLPKDKANLLNEDKELTYSLGSIAIHLFNIDFIKKLTTDKNISLPYHIAQKKIKTLTESGEIEIDGLKFEKFIFDYLLFSKFNTIFEISRFNEMLKLKFHQKLNI